MTRIAVLADIHGNRWALEAVLEHLEGIRPERVVDLGDRLFGPLDPAGTLSLLEDRDWPSVRGNQDRALLGEDAASHSPTHRFVLEEIGEAGRTWLGESTSPPFVWKDDTGAALLACHGTPLHDDEYLIEWVDAHAVRLRSMVDLDGELESLEEAQRACSLVLCGHSHVPRLLRTAAGRTILNPGSVGLPAYGAAQPFPHAMEAGSPHARFAIVEEREGRWSVEHHAVPYDHQRAAEAARRNGRADWAEWIFTGRAAPG